MQLHGVSQGLLPAVQHIIERGSEAGESQREYSGILVMFRNTASLVLKRSLNGAVQVMGLVHCSLALQMQWIYHKKRKRGMTVSQKLGVTDI